MKKRIKNRLSFLLLSLLGFAATSCKEPLDMYGTPRADFRAQGKVTDKEGNPLRGIQVRSEQYDSKEVLTADDGSYDISGSMFPSHITLSFTDIDGPENGGEFTEQHLDIKFTEADRTGKGGEWYSGSFARSGVDVRMQEKEEQE